MASLQGKVISITGAGSGLGLATARECANRGASLALSDINEEALNRVVTDLRARSINVIGTVVDVGKSDDVDAWVAHVIEYFGRLNGAVNSAGVEGGSSSQVFSDITGITNDHWDFILGVNLTGLFYCLRAQLRVMQRGASILNVASIAGVMGRPGLGAYVASKHGVVGLTKTAAKEVGKRGIRVNAIAPGPVSTPMLDRIQADAGTGNAVTDTFGTTPLQKLGMAEEIAKTICFILSDDATHTTGAVLSVDGGMSC